MTDPIYDRFVPFYDDMHAFKDYAGEADFLVEVIRRHHPTARSLLDVACGTGRHLEHLRREFEVEGLDVNPASSTSHETDSQGSRCTRRT